MDGFEDKNVRVLFAEILNDFNQRIKNIDDIFTDLSNNEPINRNMQIIIEDKFLNRLYLMMKVIMFDMGYNFTQLYDRLYWDKMFSFVKELWAAMPEGKPVLGAKKGFKDLFEDFHDQVIIKYPNLLIKQLQDVGSMYRCRSWEVNEGYELMIPDERYVKDNRWNPDGVAYLYLACGNVNDLYDETINMVQKTCFEEISLKDEREVAICQFKPNKKDAKIIDLCYEGVNLPKLTQELKVPPPELTQTVLDAINGSPQLTEIMKELFLKNMKDEFTKKANPYIKKIIKKEGIDQKIGELVYSRTSAILLGIIDESIFEAVDKIDDPELKAYLPFRAFSQYLIGKGYDGIIYRSTKMNKIGLRGKNLVLFDKNHAVYQEGTMKKYKYSSGKYIKFA